MTNLIPTADDCRRIREFAKDESGRWTGRRSVTLEAGERYNLDDSTVAPSINILRVDACPDWNNSDLADHVPWADFRTYGVELTADGRAMVDFYVYNGEGLACNVQAEFDASGLVALHADVEKDRWTRPTVARFKMHRDPDGAAYLAPVLPRFAFREERTASAIDNAIELGAWA